MRADAAQVLLSGAGIPFTVVFREAEEAEVGLVLEVDPAGGSVIAEGGSVVLVVGKRKEPVERSVPTDLVRKTADAAQVLLSGAGIPSTVVFRETEEAEVGLVLEVDPAGGSVIAEGGSVVLVVGKRKEPVEPRVPMDLVRKTVDAAQALLSGAGIPSTVTFREAEEAEVGLVLETSPAGGTLLAPGGSVHLLVGKAKEGLPPTPLRGGDLSTEIPAIP